MSMIALPSRLACQSPSASANVCPGPWMQKSTWHVVPPNAAAVWPDVDVVDRGRAAERHVEVRVRVDGPASTSFPDASTTVSAGRLAAIADGDDALALDDDVADEAVGRGDDAAALDQHGHRDLLSSHLGSRAARAASRAEMSTSRPTCRLRSTLTLTAFQLLPFMFTPCLRSIASAREIGPVRGLGRRLGDHLELLRDRRRACEGGRVHDARCRAAPARRAC